MCIRPRPIKRDPVLATSTLALLVFEVVDVLMLLSKGLIHNSIYFHHNGVVYVGLALVLYQAIASGLTTLLGGGTGPATGTRATTCTPHPSHVSIFVVVVVVVVVRNCF